MTGSASRKNLEHPASEHAVTCLWQAKPCRVFTAQNCPDHRQGSNVLLLSLHKCMQKPVRRIPFTERTGLGKHATPFDFLHTPFFFCFLKSLKVAIITIFNMQQEFPREEGQWTRSLLKHEEALLDWTHPASTSSLWYPRKETFCLLYILVLIYGYHTGNSWRKEKHPILTQHTDLPKIQDLF